MPQYDFIAVDRENRCCEYCTVPFEVFQSMSEDPILQCPKCGNAVKKFIGSCNVSKKKSTKSVLSDKNLSNNGFVKLVNEGGGKFRKTT